MLQMKTLYAKQTLYTFLLLFLPALIIVSWINVFTGNTNYTVATYFLTYILPATLFAYIISLITAGYLHEGYFLTYLRVLFTLVGLIFMLFFFSYIVSFLGYNSLFLTLTVPSPGTTQTDPLEIASKFYSFELLTAMLALVLFYSVGSHMFQIKPTSSAIKKPAKKKSEVSKVMTKKSTAIKKRAKKK